MIEPVELVIFDCHGVLVDSEPIAVRVHSAVLSALGRPIGEAEVIERFVGRSTKSINELVEDSRYGVQAARAAGMRAFGYSGGLTPAQWLEGADTVVFDDMRELPGLLDRFTPADPQAAATSGVNW